MSRITFTCGLSSPLVEESPIPYALGPPLPRTIGARIGTWIPGMIELPAAPGEKVRAPRSGKKGVVPTARRGLVGGTPWALGVTHSPQSI